MIRMKHELHGFHMANSLEEVDMRKNGWIEDAPAPIDAESVTSAPPDSLLTADTSTVSQAEKRKYNRKAK